MARKLTIKQRKFLDHYFQHHNLAAAAKHAGSKGKTKETLSNCGRSILDGCELSFQEKLNEYGLSDEFLIKKLLEGLGASKVEIATFRGRIQDERSYIDFPTRGKYLEMLSRMKGAFVDRQEISGRDGGEITLVVQRSGKARPHALSFEK